MEIYLITTGSIFIIIFSYIFIKELIEEIYDIDFKNTLIYSFIYSLIITLLSQIVIIPYCLIYSLFSIGWTHTILKNNEITEITYKGDSTIYKYKKINN